jgi:hypothetical protein
MAAKGKAKGSERKSAKKSAAKPGRASQRHAAAKPKGKRPSQPASEIARQPAGLLPPGYAELLEDIKSRIRRAQVRAAVGANRELIRLYWDIGREIVQRQEREGWGKGIVDRLAADVQRDFPGIEGFSPRNVWRMRAFYVAYTQELANLTQPVSELDGVNLPQAVSEIPWGHNIGIILCKTRDKVTVEYALRDTRKPIGVSEYRLTDAIPQKLKPSLPTIEQLEAELKSVKPEDGA